MYNPQSDIYLDHAASTPLDPRVERKMFEVASQSFANPSSIHAPGRRARRIVEEARDAVAEAIGAKPREIVFTSGATEADNMALRGLRHEGGRPGVLTSPLEHSAVLATAKALAKSGREVIFLEPSANGEIDSEALKAALTPNIGVVALMLVNNEVGIRTPIEKFSAIVHEAGALLFCDAVQAFGFEEIDVHSLGVDAMALSAHKAYGPKGIGALWVREGLKLDAVTFGGEQERGYRPGTLNTMAIAGLGQVATIARAEAAAHGEEIRTSRDRFESLIAGAEGVNVNGAGAPRGPKHSSVSVDGVDGEALLMSLDTAGVYASTGSACSAGSVTPSHVLQALGLPPAQAKATVRFSFGRAVAPEQVEEAAQRFLKAVERCRTIFA